MAISSRAEIPPIVQKKLDAFAKIEEEFAASFRFVQAVHGQQRFAQFPVASTVRYLHALWVCECKAGLLSVSRTVKEYEGAYSLQLLRNWQTDENTASVVEFLHRKLDMLPLDEITRQVHEARHIHMNDGLARRLMHGRRVLLNRGITMMHALDVIFSLPEDALFVAIHEVCTEYGHLPAQIDQQLADLQTPLYSFIPHQILAQRNMQVMNELGIKVAARPADLPGQRSWRVLPATEDPEMVPPFAEHVVQGYRELTAPRHNNLLRHRFQDVTERSVLG